MIASATGRGREIGSGEIRGPWSRAECEGEEGIWAACIGSLHIPIKYGYKQIGRIDLIAYADTRPNEH